MRVNSCSIDLAMNFPRAKKKSAAVVLKLDHGKEGNEGKERKGNT